MIRFLNVKFSPCTYSVWTSNDEEYVLPLLVHTGAKPIASLVAQNNTKGATKQLRKRVEKICEDFSWDKVKRKVTQNKWGVHVVVLYQQSSNSSDITNWVGSISDRIICKIINETASWDEMGKFYGYNDNIYDSTSTDIGPEEKMSKDD